MRDAQSIDPAKGLSYVRDMALLPIITVPDPLLREVSSEIPSIDADALRLADDMLETMYDAPGIGLAAIQVAIPKRLIVMDIAGDEDEPNPIVMFNPEIVKRDGPMSTYEEGCLSIPDVRVEVERPSLVTVKYIDRDGKQQQLEADGLLSTVIQHEVDHLEGQMIIDFLSKLKRDMVIKKLRKLARERD